MSIIKPTLLSILIIIQILAAVDSQDIQELINDMQKTTHGEEFLRTHGERDLITVLLFLREPTRHFLSIQLIPFFFEYIQAYETYLGDRDRLEDSVIYLFLQKHFKVIDKRKAEILTYLLLNADGVCATFLAEHYTISFESNPEVFIEDLEKRENWKIIIQRLETGDLSAFYYGLQKVASSSFTKELTKYARQYFHWDKFCLYRGRVPWDLNAKTGRNPDSRPCGLGESDQDKTPAAAGLFPSSTITSMLRVCNP